MSKYYKAEDVIKCVAQYIMTDAKRDNSYVCGDIEDYIELTEAILTDLSTIEVSEGVIGYGSKDFDLQAVTSTTQDIYVKGYEDGRKSVEVSEDYTNGFKDGQKDILIFLLEGMKNALKEVDLQ